METVGGILDQLTVEGELYEKLADGAVRCFACGHRCLIREGRRGICQVRFNEGGVLYVPWGYVAALQVDPIEKKPFFHVLPGADALTFGMLGCDFHCDYCQNHLTSQAMRDPASDVALAWCGVSRPSSSSSTPGAAAPGDRLILQRAADHLGVGGEHFPAGAARKGCDVSMSRTATPRLKCWIICAPI